MFKKIIFTKANKTWEVLKTNRRIIYKLKEIKMGSLFGHEDLLFEINRKCRVRAITACDIIYINK
jgi:CRP-like cAMP-binding protein